eukprot:2701141-Pleurochrysis_carterae.AAC.2
MLRGFRNFSARCIGIFDIFHHCRWRVKGMFYRFQISCKITASGIQQQMIPSAVLGTVVKSNHGADSFAGLNMGWEPSRWV